MLRKVHITPIYRVIVEIVQLLPQDDLVIDKLRMTAFLYS